MHPSIQSAFHRHIGASVHIISQKAVNGNLFYDTGITLYLPTHLVFVNVNMLFYTDSILCSYRLLLIADR